MEKKNIYTRPAFIVLFAVIVTALWGSATPAIKVGYELFHIEAGDIPTKILFAGVRFTLAGVMVLIAGTAARRPMLPRKQDWGPAALLGGMQTTLAYIFFYIGLTYTTGAKGSLFSSVNAFIVVLAAPLFYKSEHWSARKLFGCVLGFIGLVLVTTGGDGGSLSGFHLMGEGFVLGCSVCNAAGALYTKKIAKDRDTVMLTAWQLLIGGLLLAVIGLIGGGHLEMTSLPAMALLGYMALLSAVAFGLQTQLIRYNPVSKITFYNLLIPLFGTVLSGIFLNENILTVSNLLALLFVCCGIGIVNYPRQQKA